MLTKKKTLTKRTTRSRAQHPGAKAPEGEPRPQREEEEKDIEVEAPEKVEEKPDEVTKPTEPARDDRPEVNGPDARWTIPGGHHSVVNQPKETPHGPSHVDYLEPNRKD